MSKVSTERLTDVFVEVADTLIEEFDLIEFLEMLTQRIAELVDAPAVGLLLADQRGSLQFMASSTEGAHLLELFQLQNHEGPCPDAFRTGEPVHQDDLTQAAARCRGSRGTPWPTATCPCTPCPCACGARPSAP
jgi:GAF domain-containing protein